MIKWNGAFALFYNPCGEGWMREGGLFQEPADAFAHLENFEVLATDRWEIRMIWIDENSQTRIRVFAHTVNHEINLSGYPVIKLN